MNKLRIKESYLILLIIISLVSLGIYTTFALFTASTTISDVVGITTTLDIGKSMSEYEVVTVPAGETKLIELNVVNSYNNSIYYGAWYQIVQGNNDNIQIGLYTEKNSNPSSGTLTASSNIKLLAGITNDNTSSIIVYLGVKGSLTNELNLGSNKALLPDGFSEALLVTEEVLEAHKETKTDTVPVNKAFSATGAVQNVTLNKGTYKLEVWGAQGGNYNTTYTGGKGGYSYGTLTLNNTTNLYVYVGKQAQTITTDRVATTGGFNGGGNGFNRYYSGTYTYAQGGGGASDIRIGQDSLYSRVIVAGGGSGATNRTNGYYGGGTSGGTGLSGYAGSQTSAGTNGSFGTGGSATTSGNNYKYGSAGGGGGWYGGGASTSYSDNTNYDTYSGGGSGYVYTSSTASNYPSGNLLTSTYYLTNAATVGGNTSFASTSGGTETGHSGNGYAKITGNEIGTITYYTIPNLTGLTDLKVQLGTSVSLTDGTTLTCENNTTTGCSITNISITDTSSLTEGTYVVTYTVKGANNKKYLFNRNVIVAELNSPDLVQGLIPVKYDESSSTWVKADSTNTNNSWYDYNNKLWANAVLVTSKNRSTYQNATPGTTISTSDILAFYVWIPRYKYKVWNISKQAGAESTYAYKAKTEGIDIVFEVGTGSTGTINCEYNYNVDSANGGVDLSTTTAETCTGNNGDYYTHPAFTFGNDNINGFWISKFEISSSDPSATYGGGNVTNLTVRSLPNVNSWRNITVSNINTVIQNMQTSSNIYGLNTSRTNTDSHVLTNYEWGAVAYLTNSKYGRCTDGSCIEVTINNCSSYVTGIGANTVSASGSSTTCTTAANQYNGTYGKLASTTGNITGVYDMSGGSAEFVMGNISKVTTGYTFYPSNSSFASSWYTTSTAKYLTTYAYDEKLKNQKAYNRGRLGDATAEVVFSTGGSGGWYSDDTIFPYYSFTWFYRGGLYDYGSTTGVFYFYGLNGSSNSSASSRAALVSLSA